MTVNLPEKLKTLRAARGLTQEAVAEHLGISGQTVSKWERGLLSPDISLLPHIAVLYGTSLDALFDMNTLRADAAYDGFCQRIRRLRAAGDKEGEYRAYISQIELVPDHFDIYPDLFLFVLRQEMFDEARIRRLLRLAEYAQVHCKDDNIRYAIYQNMARICIRSANFTTQAQAREYLRKLPLLRYAREIVAPEILEGKEREAQLKWTILYTADLCDCAMRRLIDKDTLPERRIDINRRASIIYETLLGEGYGGFWDIPLLFNYTTMVRCLLPLGRAEEADAVMERFFAVLSRHALPPEERVQAEFVSSTHPYGYMQPERSVEALLRGCMDDAVFRPYLERLEDLYRTLYTEK